MSGSGVRVAVLVPASAPRAATSATPDGWAHQPRPQAGHRQPLFHSSEDGRTNVEKGARAFSAIGSVFLVACCDSGNDYDDSASPPILTP